MTADVDFGIAILGLMAARHLVGPVVGLVGRVASVFETTFTVEFAGNCFVCVATAGVDNGPLNAICLETVHSEWRHLGVAEGQAVAIENGLMQLAGGPVFDVRRAAVWLPPPWPSEWDAGCLNAGLDALDVIAAGRAPADGLAGVAFAANRPAGLSGAVLRSARLKTATLSDWLAGRLAGRLDAGLDTAARLAVRGLIGLGPGLTPSGDDVVAGLAIALAATGETETVAALAGFIRDAPANATSAFSRALLDAAIEGLPSAVLHSAVAALLLGGQAGGPIALAAAVVRLDGVGHTSGWDMLAGAVLGLRAVAGQAAVGADTVGADS